jgi:hypothetical protein
MTGIWFLFVPTPGSKGDPMPVNIRSRPAQLTERLGTCPGSAMRPDVRVPFATSARQAGVIELGRLPAQTGAKCRRTAATSAAADGERVRRTSSADAGGAADFAGTFARPVGNRRRTSPVRVGAGRVHEFSLCNSCDGLHMQEAEQPWPSGPDNPVAEPRISDSFEILGIPGPGSLATPGKMCRRGHEGCRQGTARNSVHHSSSPDLRTGPAGLKNWPTSV